MSSMLARVLSGLLQSGVHQEDIAILVGKRRDVGHVQEEVTSLGLDQLVPGSDRQEQGAPGTDVMATRRWVHKLCQVVIDTS